VELSQVKQLSGAPVYGRLLA